MSGMCWYFQYYFDFKIYFMFRASLYTKHQADPETKESEASEFEQNI